MKLNNIVASLLIILFAVVLRLLPHPANIAPITAIALFGGVYLNKKYAFILPIVIMVISDIFLGFHNTILFVYGSFFITGILGLWIRNNKNTLKVISTTFASSILFFIITNFGVWLVSGMYELTFNGLVNAYVLAIPYFRNTVLGDLLYTGLLFSAYELIIYLAKNKTTAFIKSK